MPPPKVYFKSNFVDPFLDADLSQKNSSCQGVAVPLDNTQEQENMWSKCHNPEHLKDCCKSLKLWSYYQDKADKCGGGARSGREGIWDIPKWYLEHMLRSINLAAVRSIIYVTILCLLVGCLLLSRPNPHLQYLQSFI